VTKLLAAALLAASASLRISYKARLADRDGKVIYLTNLRQG
jgi:hypothetical protein